jgi:uncharacterized repeat protein (TIGR03803 family)
MNYRRLLGGASAALIVVALILAPGASAASNYKTLYQFKGGADGSLPYASLIFDPAGNLYGTTANGGAYGYGVIFKLSSNLDGKWTESVIYSFAGGADGSHPSATLILAADGNLYGTTRTGGTGSCTFQGNSGCGTAFKLTPNPDGTWSETVIYSFSRVPDGFVPSFGGLTSDESGNLYGGTHYGGKTSTNCASGCGTVFRLAPNLDGTWTESVLYRFDEANGWNPFGSLLLNQASIFGITSNGGGDRGLNCPFYPGCGAVFELTANMDGSWTQKVLHRYKGQLNGDGGISYGGLTLGSGGVLYGTTGWGAPAGVGGLFTETPQTDGSWRYQWSHSFPNGKGPAIPWGTLTTDASGNLYGVTLEGGGSHDNCVANYAYGCGTVFRLTKTNGRWSQKMLHGFRNRPGAYPRSGVILDVSGKLYGTTSGDGKTSFGSVYQIIP